jgi:putative membrane protein
VTTPPPGAPAPEGDDGWQRLDPRMLLVHPIREVVRFLPALIAVAVAGTASGGAPWQLIGVAVPVALGLLRYLTTRFRVADGRVELRRGLVSRRTTSVPVDRVRTVDLTSSVVQRALGLTTLRIGTGVAASGDDDGLDLDGLPADRARSLRDDLLHATPVAVDPDDPDALLVAAPVEPPAVAEFDPRWLRFAPFTGTGLVVVLAAVGGASQLLDAADAWDRLADRSLPVPSVLGALGLVAAALGALLAVTVVGYLVVNGGYRLTRQAGSWHVRRGLLTTRETSIDEDRLAGVAIGEPLALRLARGRHLQAIATGVKRSEAGSSMLVPPSDADVSPRVARTLLGRAGPVDGPLVPHGPAAARRRWTRGLLPTAPLVAVAVVAVATGAPWWVLVPAAVVVLVATTLAADRVSGLGHALLDGYVVARSGSVLRRREALGAEHVIGWTFRDTWFQRRVGLTTLAATTAGGRGAVAVLDVPEADGVRLADEAVPDLVAQFCQPLFRPSTAPGVRRAAPAETSRH